MRIEILKSVILTFGRMEAGDTVELAEPYALNLIAAGYAAPAGSADDARTGKAPAVPAEGETKVEEGANSDKSEEPAAAKRGNTRGSKAAPKG